jgi:hypothetical protein
MDGVYRAGGQDVGWAGAQHYRMWKLPGGDPTAFGSFVRVHRPPFAEFTHAHSHPIACNASIEAVSSRWNSSGAFAREAVMSEADLLSNASAWMGHPRRILTDLRSHTGNMR